MTPPKIDDSTAVVRESDAELLAIEFSGLPFVVRRVFVVTRTGAMRSRGNHYAGGHQKLVLISGKVNVHLKKADSSLREYQLVEVGSSTLIEPDDFVTYELLEDDSQILVLADESYEDSKARREKQN